MISEERQTYQKAYRAKHRLRLAAAQREYQARPDVIEKRRGYRKDRRDKQREYDRRPDVRARKNHLRRLRGGWDKQRDYYKERRNLAIDKLGGACSACGEDDKDVLQIDHIVELAICDPLAAGLRRGSNGEGSSAVVSKILEGRESKNYQLLCCNCHRRKTLQFRKTRQKSERVTQDNLVRLETLDMFGSGQ